MQPQKSMPESVKRPCDQEQQHHRQNTKVCMSPQRNETEPESETIIQVEVEPDSNENLRCSESSDYPRKITFISHQPTHETIHSKEIRAEYAEVVPPIAANNSPCASKTMPNTDVLNDRIESINQVQVPAIDLSLNQMCIDIPQPSQDAERAEPSEHANDAECAESSEHANDAAPYTSTLSSLQTISRRNDCESLQLMA